MDDVPSSSKGEYYGIVHHTRYKAKYRLEHLKIKLNNIYHLFRSDNLSFVIHLLLYHATMVIEFDCIVVICALLLFVIFLFFSFFTLSVFLSFLHED